MANLFLIYCKPSLRQLVTKVAVESFPRDLQHAAQWVGEIFALVPATYFAQCALPPRQFAWLVTLAMRNLRAFCILVVSLRCINNFKHPAPFLSQSVAPFLLFQCAICMYEKLFPHSPPIPRFLGKLSLHNSKRKQIFVCKNFTKKRKMLK